jgi:hypothetical protein
LGGCPDVPRVNPLGVWGPGVEHAKAAGFWIAYLPIENLIKSRSGAWHVEGFVGTSGGGVTFRGGDVFGSAGGQVRASPT